MEQHIPTPGKMRSVLRVIGAALFGLAALCTEADAAQFTLTWTDNSTNETGFRIERSTNGTAFTEVATVGANIVSYVDAGLPNSTAYWYRLRAYNTAGNSGYSNVATGTTPPLLSNNPPTISAIAARAINTGSNTGAIPFTVGDVETAAASLTLSAASSNTTLVPVSGIAFGGSGANRTVTVTPTAARTGSATITVSVSDDIQSTSISFVVTVSSVSITAQPQATTISPGSAMTLSVTAQSSSALTYQWYFNGTAISGATGASYTVPLAQRFNAGTYHVVVTAGGVAVTSSSVVVTAGSVVSTGQLANLSSRAMVGTGGSILVPGFVISGTGSKRVLLRAVGPTLAGYGVSGTLADPQLVLKRGDATLASNLDWSDGGGAATLQQTFAQVGAFSLDANSGDSVLLVDLTPGSYTVSAADEQGTRTGIAMVEFYDADLANTNARMANLSNRGLLGVGNETMTTGFVVESGSVTMLIRTVGPGLAQYGVTGTVANPQMTLSRSVSGTSETLAVNDDWSSSDATYTQQVTQQVGAFALTAGSRDAAMVVTLPEGVYTVGSGGVNSTTGLALVELYVVP